MNLPSGVEINLLFALGAPVTEIKVKIDFYWAIIGDLAINHIVHILGMSGFHL